VSFDENQARRMRTTTHILNHPVASIILLLDEDTGQFDLCPCSLPPSAEQLPAFHAAIRRWCRQIARGWAQRNMHRFSTDKIQNALLLDELIKLPEIKTNVQSPDYRMNTTLSNHRFPKPTTQPKTDKPERNQ